MTVDKVTLQLIQELSDAFGPSGFEDDVLKVVRNYVKTYDLGMVEEDCMRNLYIYRKENVPGKPLCMLDAHSDEVGFMVHSIKPNGLLRFITLGRWNNDAIFSSDVVVRNAEGEYLPGVTPSKPVHFLTKGEANAQPDITDYTIDVGASSAKEAVEVYKVRIGEPATSAKKFRFDEKTGKMFGKGFDCRVGVASALETLRRLKGIDLPCNLVVTLSSQEELGERGCKVAVHHVKPDIALCFEGCPADDTFTEPYAIQTALGKGPMLRHMDVSVICSPRYQRFALDMARKEGLTVQESVRIGGGNDAAVINTAFDGIPAIVAGVPVRYVHSMVGIADYYDVERTIAFAMSLVQKLDQYRIAGF